MKSGKAEKKKHHDNKKDELIVRMSEIERRIEDLKKELELQRKMIQKILDFWNEHKGIKLICYQISLYIVSSNFK